jgi:UDP-glucose 4-epimerase
VHGDGKQTRSFTFISDTVAGIYAAISKDAANGEIINIGSQEEVTILELAETVARLCGAESGARITLVPYESFSGKPYQDVMRRIPDTTLCERLLGVKAHVRLEEGLKQTIAWQREARVRRAAAK